ncbi:MAG: hypothetical protein AABX70_07560 [Nanoarchaeota archaeon]
MATLYKSDVQELRRLTADYETSQDPAKSEALGKLLKLLHNQAYYGPVFGQNGIYMVSFRCENEQSNLILANSADELAQMERPIVFGSRATHVWNDKDMTYFKERGGPISVPGYDAQAKLFRAHCNEKPHSIVTVPRGQGLEWGLAEFQAVYESPKLVVHTPILHNPVSDDLGVELEKMFDLMYGSCLGPLLPPTRS